MSNKKLGQQVKPKKKLVHAIEATVSVQLSMFPLLRSWKSWKMDHVGSKLGQRLKS